MRINEIFYSLQGEGRHTGTPAIFIRFAGCNLKCPFCDTEHTPFVNMTEGEIVREVLKYPSRLLVVTGGEPALQLTESLVAKLKGIGKLVAVETNGTLPLPINVDWITVSPKDLFIPTAKVVLERADELKVVFDGTHRIPQYDISVKYRYLQPCDTGNPKKNREITEKCINYIKNNPKWKLSLQTQKILNVR